MKNKILEMPEGLSYKSKIPFVRMYFNKIHNIAIKLAKPLDNKKILDFGCGSGKLKQKLKDYNVVNYDINEKLSEISDYKKLRPDIIFSLSVFEHIDIMQIEEIIKNFKDMNKNLILILAIPKETFLNKTLAFIFGVYKLNKEAHVSSISQIYYILNKHMKKQKIKKIPFLCEV